ncbi:hypothetical protein FRB90_012700 [Tulasnella sp. 427]|nr:hypothetical protein FRB90_012700 [Tulasnella sp. 427]
MSIYETGKYIQAKKRARLPRLFMEAFSLAITIWVMSHAVGIADFYLHATTHAILVDIPAFDAAPGSYPYSVAFNRTPCGNASYTYAPWEDSCVSYYTGRYTYEAYGLAFATITNQTRSKFQVKTLADASDAAIIVPTNAVDLSSIMYTAQTIGARAQCRSLNSDCRDVFQLNCTKAGFPSLPFYKEELTGMMPTDGFVSDGTPVSLILGYIDGQLVNATMGHTKNPVKLGVQLQRNLYANQASANQASVPVEPKAGSADSALDYVYLASKPAIVTLLAACSVEFSNLTIQYSPSSRSWTIVHEEPSSDNFASILWTPTVSQMGTDQLANEIMPFAEGNHVINVTAALNQGLARMMLGLAVGPMYLAEASNVRLVVPTLLGQYPVGAIMALVILLLLYAVLTLFIFASSWLTMDETIVVSGDQNGAPKEQSVLNLTQRWLVNPLPLVAAAFPGNDDKDVQRTVAGSAVEMVYDENGSDIRVSIGLHPRTGFGLRKRRAGH